MPPPDVLTTVHLAGALVPAPVPAAGAAPVADARAHLAVAIDRLDVLVEVVGAWRDRFPHLPPPPQQESLADLVQAARRRLREEQSRVELEELDARRFVLRQVRSELEP